MGSLTITYGGNTIYTSNADDNFVLKTGGKFLTDDITLTAVDMTELVVSYDGNDILDTSGTVTRKLKTNQTYCLSDISLNAVFGTTYIWDVYNVAYSPEWASGTSTWDYASGNRMTVSNMENVAVDGSGFALVNASSSGVHNLQNKYFVAASGGSASAISGQNLYYCTNVASSISIYYTVTYQTASVIQARGSSTGQTVQSADITDYPANGVQDGYWYVLRTSNNWHIQSGSTLNIYGASRASQSGGVLTLE